MLLKKPRQYEFADENSCQQRKDKRPIFLQECINSAFSFVRNMCFMFM